MKPLTKLAALAIFFLSLQSCKKRVDFTPPSEASLIRILDFPNRGYISKSEAYEQPDSLDAYITNNENHLRLIFQGKKNGCKGQDAVVIDIPKNQLHNNFAGLYTFGSNTHFIHSVRHTYSYSETNSSYWANISELSTTNFERGQLEIDYYDATRQLIGGTFSVKMVNLRADPTIKNSTNIYDPLQKCDMILVGTFRYMPLPK